MPIRRYAVLIAVLTGLLFTADAHAAGPCAADVQKLCADKTGGAVQTCLKSKHSELSDPCKKQLDVVKGWVGPLVAPCQYDITVLCADVAPGGGRLKSCLEAKRDQLSPECKDGVGKPAAP